jgi:hypothetical protein
LSSPRLDRDGSRIAADNRRQPIAYLQQLVEEQQQIAQIAKRLARYEDADSGELASAKRPAIYWTGNRAPPRAPGLAARLNTLGSRRNAFLPFVVPMAFLSERQEAGNGSTVRWAVLDLNQ